MTSVTLRIPGVLRRHVDGQTRVTATGDTLRDVMIDLDSRHPELCAAILEDGFPREARVWDRYAGVNIYVDDEDIRYLAGMATKLRDGDEVTIMPAVAGGSADRPSPEDCPTPGDHDVFHYCPRCTWTSTPSFDPASATPRHYVGDGCQPDGHRSDPIDGVKAANAHSLDGVRRGRDTYDPPTTFSRMNLWDAIARVQFQAGGADAHRPLLDPDRVAQIQGVVHLADGQPMNAVGEKLLTNGLLGADLLVVPSGGCFPPHVHPGHHLLLALTPGTFTLDGVVHEVAPGDLSMIEGGVPHAVGNPYDLPHLVLAIGAPPKELDAEDRMVVVDWDGTPVHAPEGYRP